MFRFSHRPQVLGAATATVLALSSCATTDDSTDAASGQSIDTASVPHTPVFEGEYGDYRTRPDLPRFGAEISPGPAMDQAYDGVIVLSPRNTETDDQGIANAILDRDGEPLWLQGYDDIDEDRDYVHNALVQSYEDESVLTWWEGVDYIGYGYGDVVVADSSYEEILRMPTAGGLAEGAPISTSSASPSRAPCCGWPTLPSSPTSVRSVGRRTDGSSTGSCKRSTWPPAS